MDTILISLNAFLAHNVRYVKLYFPVYWLEPIGGNLNKI